MLNYFDKAGFTLIAGGVLGQFFTSSDTLVRGCTATHNATGIWTITLPSAIAKPNYLFLAAPLSAFNPGLTISMTDTGSLGTEKLVQIKNSNTAAFIDVDVSFMLFEIPVE